MLLSVSVYRLASLVYGVWRIRKTRMKSCAELPSCLLVHLNIWVKAILTFNVSCSLGLCSMTLQQHDTPSTWFALANGTTQGLLIFLQLSRLQFFIRSPIFCKPFSIIGTPIVLDNLCTACSWHIVHYSWIATKLFGEQPKCRRSSALFTIDSFLHDSRANGFLSLTHYD